MQSGGAQLIVRGLLQECVMTHNLKRATLSRVVYNGQNLTVLKEGSYFYLDVFYYIISGWRKRQGRAESSRHLSLFAKR